MENSRPHIAAGLFPWEIESWALTGERARCEPRNARKHWVKLIQSKSAVATADGPKFGLASTSPAAICPPARRLMSWARSWSARTANRLAGSVTMWKSATLLLAALLVTADRAIAQELDPKVCILAAAEKLPHIPGLIATGGRIGQLPATFKVEPGITHVMVEIDVTAAGQLATYNFLCSASPGKPIFTQRLGLPR